MPTSVYLGLQKQTESKLSWYEGEFQPVVGTSVMLEVDPTNETCEVVGANTYQMKMNRKYFGSKTKINKASILKRGISSVLKEEVRKNSRITAV